MVYCKLGLKVLTLSLQVLCFVLLSTKQSSCSFLEEALGRAGVVKVWGCVAAVSRQSVWCQTLIWEGEKKQAQSHWILEYTELVKMFRLHKETHTWQKKSWRRISSSCGLSTGFLASILLMRCLAWGDKDDGMEYRASRMHRYVSLRFVVSNGGLPKSMVYLLGHKLSIINKLLHEIQEKHPPCSLQLKKKDIVCNVTAIT